MKIFKTGGFTSASLFLVCPHRLQDAECVDIVNKVL